MTAISGSRSRMSVRISRPLRSGKLKIQQNEIECLRIQKAQSLFAVLRVHHLVAVIFQQNLQRFADRRFVVDNQHPARAGLSSSGADVRFTPPGQTWIAFLDIGNSMKKLVPSPGLLSTRILPACSWMMP